jgi:hypothetical protein
MRVNRLLIFAFLFWATLTLAQQPEAIDESQSTPESESPANIESPTSEQESAPAPSSTSGSFGTFNPSEDISEDISVAFPVDI